MCLTDVLPNEPVIPIVFGLTWRRRSSAAMRKPSWIPASTGLSSQFAGDQQDGH